MPQSHRERAILDHLNLTGSARIPDLARVLQVSEETIRRNVRRLEDAGTVIKVHGGVHLTNWRAEPTFAHRYVQNAGAKQAIAARVSAVIADGASVFLDVGTTTAYVAQALLRHRDLQVVTNSLAVASTLTGVNGNRVFMAGGELRRHDGGAFGAEALGFVRQFRVQVAVLSVAAIDAQAGFLLQDLPEAEFSRAVLAQSDQAIIVADGSKFTRTAPIRIAQPEAFHRLVTETAPPGPIAALLAAAGVEVTLAGFAAA